MSGQGRAVAQLAWEGLGHLRTSEVGEVLERLVRRLERHLRRSGQLRTFEDEAEPEGEGDKKRKRRPRRRRAKPEAIAARLKTGGEDGGGTEEATETEQEG